MGLPLSLRARLRALATSYLRRSAESFGYDLVRRGFYSPVPDLSELPADIWTRRSALEGIAFDTEAQLRFVLDNLSGYLSEFDPAFETGTRYGRFRLRNGAYEEVDCELLYGMVRFLRPRRVIELGSGYSSFVLAHASEVNREAGNTCDYRLFDPYPRSFIEEGIPGLTTYSAAKAQDVPLAVFEALEENDILFVDTTHTVKIGSDVNRIVLDLLPRLTPGVVVHFHDIFLPWEYHRSWIEGEWKWNEQYLIQAFLSMNPSYEVLVSSHALVREHWSEIRGLVPTLREASAPSAFWIRSC
jgi:hypothetical protein